MLRLFTTIQREDEAGDPEQIDVAVYFAVASYVPGCPAKIYGDPSHCYPAEDPEYEFMLVSIEHEPHYTDRTPLTAEELAQVKAWFFAHHDLAVDAAEAARADMEYEDADRKLDERRDARLWEDQ